MKTKQFASNFLASLKPLLKMLTQFFASKNLYGKMKIVITKIEKIFKYIGKLNLGDKYGNKSKGKI
uniref:Uncharacterized protein n=1 Tax=Candidatus Methanophaga sp. ANME-1 ERB7 TaxID=2759913 RepID=A0A7G9ZAI5_9EURY|nr:hypothetical protein HCLJFGEB_00013 [Methanosarcinales archaeon ANME-1 ERB7]